MITISLCMIVKNEEDVIGNCLESIKDVVDEINIVDTGSTDRTREIVAQYTDRIFDFKWIDDFAAARNEAFSKATKEYILWLDSDDVLLENDAKKLKELKVSLDTSVDCVTFKYQYASDQYGNPTLIFRRERLVRADRNFKWVGFIHEYIGGDKQKTLDADIIVMHRRVHQNSDRNLNIFRKKKAEGVPFSLRDEYYYGKELYYHGIYEEAIPQLESLLEKPLWVEEKIDAICKIADSYSTRREYDKAKQTLLKAFLYAGPRAEVLYRMGQVCERRAAYQEAIYWYKGIFNAKMPQGQNGFTYPEFWTWKPLIQLCVCYCRLGDLDTSYEYNEKARALQPEQEHVVYNVAYFKSIGYPKK